MAKKRETGRIALPNVPVVAMLNLLWEEFIFRQNALRYPNSALDGHTNNFRTADPNVRMCKRNQGRTKELKKCVEF